MSDSPTDPTPPELLVRDLHEEGLLARILPLLPSAPTTIVGPGDDCAVIAAPDGRYVVSTDVLVEDRHFRRRWSGGFDVGWRAAAQNLADIAAMGARPAALVVCLVMPGDLAVAWVEGVARGLAAACVPHGAAVVGGDISGGDQIVVAVTVHGDLEGRAPVLRSGARVGDVVAHAGRCGWSAAGLAVLEAGVAVPSGPVPGVLRARGSDVLAEYDDVVAAYLRPDPPLSAGVGAAVAGATAMLDVSDGLLRDGGRLARASGVVLDLDPGAFDADRARLLAAARAVVGDVGDGTAPGSGAADRGADRLVTEWVLTGGEDHGLLATFPAGVALPPGFRAIGHVRAAGPGDDDAAGGGPGAVLLAGDRPRVGGVGWDHFAG